MTSFLLLHTNLFPYACIVPHNTDSDDTTLILDGTPKSLERSFVILEKFGKVSSLRVNCEKTEALWIDSKKGSNQTICSEKKLKWADGKVKMGFYLKAVVPSRNLGLMRISRSRFKQSKNC